MKIYKQDLNEMAERNVTSDKLFFLAAWKMLENLADMETIRKRLSNDRKCRKQIHYTFILRILTGKKYPKIKLQRLRKIQIWIFGSLVHQINLFWEVLKLKQIFQKNRVVTGKTPLLGPFCSNHSICLNIDF